MRKAASYKPPKPYEGFPLGPANCGSWCKKIRGKIYYFGKWGEVRNGKLERLPDDGWKAALERYEQQRDALYAGRTPSIPGDDRPILRELCNQFLTAKLNKCNEGRISHRMYEEYKATTDRLIAKFGKDTALEDLKPKDFSALYADLAKAFGLVRLGNEIGKVKTVFLYGGPGKGLGLMKSQPVYGPDFVKPSKDELRKHRAKGGKRLFAAADLRRLIEAAPVQLKAMLLLGINCGFGNHDCATLPFAKPDGELCLNLDTGWIAYDARKTV